MFDIYLTDTKKQVQFKDYPGTQAVKFILNFKKIFPCVMELLLPVLPTDNNLEEMQWESTTRDFEIFKLLVSGWGIVEIRLMALSRYKNREFADQIVKNVRKQITTYQKCSTIEQDYLFLHQLHTAIDTELVEIGEKFYLPTLRQLWKGYVSNDVLQANVK
ncbi:hypothetical protein I2F27_03580 [Acinetobacter sp. B5B]|uniref:hypothetical protein n=1 Tax=Acinetobacter baretiae TaxID=2605383 RepID=UPI0018C30737|nr:hypothetical protein [Acinetobacter baretiae]MBF7682412.1 hypothetical protein [Acinetobacter baretiae]MBF7685320.1 hypothetical protein [Acinetobacter baretiae]